MQTFPKKIIEKVCLPIKKQENIISFKIMVYSGQNNDTKSLSGKAI